LRRHRTRRQERSDRGHLAAARAGCELGLGCHLTVGGEQRRGHLAQRSLRPVSGGSHGATRHRPHRDDKSWWDVGRCGRAGGIDAEGGADSHPGRAHVRAQVALGGRAANGGGGVTRQPDVSIRGDPHGRGAEATHGDAGLVKGGDSGKYGGPEGGCGWRRQRSSRQDRAERSALVGFDRDPEAVVVYTPAQDGGEGRMAMLKQALQARHGRGSFGRWHRDLVDHGRLAALEDGLPTLARTRRYKFDQPGLRL